MKKASVVILLSSILIIIFSTINYKIKCSDYYKKTSTVNSKSPEYINHIITRDTSGLDDWKIIFYSIGGRYLGESSLSRGLDGQYRIKNRENGENGENGYLLYSIREPHKGKYLIVIGENHSREIDYIVCIVEGRAYKINAPKGEYFIAYLSLPIL